jgi:hypothetical protein
MINFAFTASASRRPRSLAAAHTARAASASAPIPDTMSEDLFALIHEKPQPKVIGWGRG